IRCDAAKEVPHSFWNQLRKIIKAKRNDFLILGEVWDNSNYLIPFFEDEFDMLFDYPIYYAFEKFFNQGNRDEIDKILNLQKQIYPSNYQMIRFLSNHDNDRALSKFELDTAKYFQALTLLFTLPQTPMIYYGDEVGMLGKKPPENVRKYMVWANVDFQKNEILKFHKTLIELRKSIETFSMRNDSRSISYKIVKNNSKDVFSFLRFDKRRKFLVLINNSDDLIQNLNLQDLNFTAGYELISKTNPFYSKEKVNKILLKKLILLPRDFKVIELIK
ncbi:MAG: alpha-amylase family glycosyl hydrolase, partial [Ignavibacteria bacterium]|nr:alpha-amylase family glycosyl hydrolase [Ignavibacteria bacterium]